MTDFKQIIGRGTRVRDDYGKLFFTILDYTGSATANFADPTFDGEPVFLSEEEIDAAGNITKEFVFKPFEEPKEEPPTMADDSEGEVKKFYVDNGSVEIIADTVYDLDRDGRRIRAMSYAEYTEKEVRSMFTSVAELRSKWSDGQERRVIIDSLEDRGISLSQLLQFSGTPEADPFDALCNIAFNAPIRTRRERVDRLKTEEKEFFNKFKPEARTILSEVLDKYIAYGTSQLDDVNIFKVPPISQFGNILEISQLFGGAEKLKSSLEKMQMLLYVS